MTDQAPTTEAELKRLAEARTAHFGNLYGGPGCPECRAYEKAVSNPATILRLLEALAQAKAERERLRAALEKLRQTHYVNEDDCWYSCPAARSDWREGSANCDDSRSDDCDCGAAKANAIIDAALGVAARGALVSRP